MLLLAIILIANSLISYANKEELNVKQKADFVVKMASMISFPSTKKSNIYKLGVYGRGSEIRSLFKELESRGEKLLVNGKHVEIYNFKNSRNIVPVDLLYVSGKSKIRISELNKKLSNHPYLILTENFPYGMSMLNFATNKNSEIFYEIQEQVLKDKGAVINEKLLISSSRVGSMKAWKQKLEAALVVVKKQKQTIDKKSDEIIENKRIIQSQRITIIISILSILIISGLVIVLYRMNRQRKEALKDILDSISYAKNIQNSILPSMTLFEDHFKDFFILHKPKSVVSGDFYWLEVKDGKVLFSIADCTGHGVPGAMLSMMCSQSLTRAVNESGISEPARILDKATSLVEDYFSQSDNNINNGMDLALCSLDLKNQKVEYAGAKNPLYIFQGGELKVIKADRQSIGQSMSYKSFTNNSVDVNPGDSIYLFSDGYADQFGGPKDKKFSYKGFREVLVSIQDKPMTQQKEILSSTLDKWMDGQEQIDDISILGIRI